MPHPVCDIVSKMPHVLLVASAEHLRRREAQAPANEGPVDERCATCGLKRTDASPVVVCGGRCGLEGKPCESMFFDDDGFQRHVRMRVRKRKQLQETDSATKETAKRKKKNATDPMQVVDDEEEE